MSPPHLPSVPSSTPVNGYLTGVEATNDAATDRLVSGYTAEIGQRCARQASDCAGNGDF